MRFKKKHAARVLIVTLILSMSVAFGALSMIRADTDSASFALWRPWSTTCGCHSAATNTMVSGSVVFNAPEMVNPGELFNIELRVAGFTNAADGAISVGLHVDDMDNGEFLVSTVSEGLHGVDISGDSIDWTNSFQLTAPDSPGTYYLLAHGVDGLGGTDAWEFVRGVIAIVVSPGAHFSLSEYVESSAEYLMASAVADGGGLKWPEYNGTSAKYKTNYLKGAAGIGELFLELYESAKTDPYFTGVAPGAEVYLDIAKGAATWLQARAIAENGGFKWPRDLNADNSIAGSSANYTSMYAGAAGIGTFFLDMYRTTGDASYLTYAEGAATWLVSIANTTKGLRWAENDDADFSTQLSTRWTFGSPGIGGYFIDLFLATDDGTYAGYANQTVEGLIFNALTDEGGYSWTRYNGNTERFTGRWHGAAGIATFFLELYDLYPNATYLQYAEGTANWIFGTHEVDQGFYYPDNNAVASKSYKLGGWSRSAAGIGSMYFRMYQVTGDQNYLDNATETVDFLINNATLSNGGLSWEDSSDNTRIATALGHGLAGTGMFLVEAYQATGNSEYAAVIQGITQTLGDMAVETVNGTTWTQSDVTSDVHMGLYYGVAGVTKFLNLAAHSGIASLDDLDESIEYLMASAVADGGGLKWPEYDGISAKFKTNYLKGTAGIGSFFLQVYNQRHGDRFFAGVLPSANDYLDVAKGAATWLQARAIAENGGFKWPRDFNDDNSIAGSSANYTSMYAGAAGIGTFFLDMYRTTGDASYLTYADGAVNWLVSIANATKGLRWVEKDDADNSTELSTRWTFGSPGIGGFFINMYLATGDTTYAGYANQTVEGLIYDALTDEGGYSWTRYNGNTERFVGRWHGAAGIATFFLELYELYGNATHLDYAERIAEWIYGTNEVDQGIFFPDNNAAATKSYKIGGWSRSSAGIGGFFGRLYQTTGNSDYLGNMTQAMEFLVNNATAAFNGLVWEDSSDNARVATAIGHGISGTGLFMLDGYRLNHDYRYYQTIESIIDALSTMASTESEGSSWAQSDLTTDVHMGLYYGVAGVGQFLLRAESSYPMMDFESPVVTSPVDVDVEVDDAVEIQWTITDRFPSGWTVEIDSTVDMQSSEFTSGDVVVATVDTSMAGTFTYTITVTDFFGRTSSDSVSVTVTAGATTPTTTPTTPTTPTPGEIPLLYQIALLGSIVGNIVLIGVILSLRRR
ncbi:MAG: lanthionine synthetase LanC family protein [Candidatus Thorarchaeota archaeon]